MGTLNTTPIDNGNCQYGESSEIDQTLHQALSLIDSLDSPNGSSIGEPHDGDDICAVPIFLIIGKCDVG